MTLNFKKNDKKAKMMAKEQKKSMQCQIVVNYKNNYSLNWKAFRRVLSH
ncbi:hypothetical protein HAP32_05175 (plasmid) [Serratia fonticola]|nr:hypothetical protein HAP32_05175 [Serratia fonticola]